MKHYLTTTTFYMVLAVALTGLMIPACGSGGGGGGGKAAVVEGTVWYVDGDEDGFGSSASKQTAEDQPVGYVANANDCNDSDTDINPMAEEIMNDGIDNNCNGLKNETFTAQFPDTGQTRSYTDTFGEDSDFTIDAPSYTKLDTNQGELSDSARVWSFVRDNVTGLIWEVKDSGDGYENPEGNLQDVDNRYTWNGAQAFISDMNDQSYGGFDDWRLPTVKELGYLANSGVFTGSFPLDYFPYAGSLSIWSAIEDPTSPDDAWYVSTLKGIPFMGAKTKLNSVWAVRGSQAASSFHAFDKDIVFDSTTGLMWQMNTAMYDEESDESNHLMTFEEALEYCEGLELGGFKDWRLPNRNELASLLGFDSDTTEPSIEGSFFTNTLNIPYWTSSTFITINNSDYTNAWGINFFTSSISYILKNSKGAVLAVRGGKNTATRIWYEDADHDIYGDPGSTWVLESTQPQPDGYSPRALDCDDSDPSINPAAIDIENDGIDQDCTGLDVVTYYRDEDGDGFGTPGEYVYAETPPDGYVDNNSDCDDENQDVNPDAEEMTGDGIDNDCDGVTL